MRPSTQAVLEEAFQRIALRERADALSEACQCMERGIAQGKTVEQICEDVALLMGETADDLIAMSLLIEGEEVKQ